MITVGALADIDVIAYVFAGAAVMAGVLLNLAARQARWQAREDAAVERWRHGPPSD